MPATTPTPGPDPDRYVDRRALLDPTRCPCCGATLSASRCGRCGVDLSGPLAASVWELSGRVARLLDARLDAVAQLRRQAWAGAPVTFPGSAPGGWAGAPRPAPAPSRVWPAAPASAPVPAPAPAAPPGAAPSAPWPTPPRPAAPRPASARSSARLGAQVLLVGLGALLLAVAAVVFLVLSWDRLPLGGRAAVIGVFTLAALGSALRLRPGLGATAEAVGGLAVVLVLADAWAVRSTGLLGADRMDGRAYAAAAVAGCAALLAGWGSRGGVRAGTVAAAVLAPAVPALAGSYLASLGGGLRVEVLGVLLAAGVAAARSALPRRWGTEVVLLRWGAGLWLWAGLAGVAGLALRGSWGETAAMLVLVAVVAGVQARGDRELLPAACGWWSALAAGTVTAAGWPVAARLAAGRAGGGSWMLALAPGVGAAMVVALVPVLARLRGSGLRPGPALLAGGAALALLTLPAAVIDAWQVLLAPAAAVPPWRSGALARVHAVLPAAGMPGGAAGPGRLAAALGLAAAAAAAAAVHRRWHRAGFTPGRAAAPLGVLGGIGTGLALVAGPLAVDLPLAVALTLLLALAVAAAVAMHRGRRVAGVTSPVGSGTALGVAVTAGTLAVVLSWCSRDLSVPITTLGMMSLRLARRPVPAMARPVPVGAAAAASLVVVGAVAALAGAAPTDRLTVAGLFGSALVALAVTVAPTPGLRRALPVGWRPAGPALAAAERGVAATVGLVGALIAVLAAVVGAGDAAVVQPGRLAVLFGALLAVAVAVAIRPTGPLAGAASGVAAGAAACAPPLAGALLLAVRAAAVPQLAAAPVLAAGCAAGAVVLAVAALRAPAWAGPRRLLAEGATALVGALAAAMTRGIDQAWVVLLLLGTGAAALALVPDRQAVGRLAWVLLSASSWVRLGSADVHLVEAYTLPPAAALLVVGGLRLRRDPRTGPWRALGPATGLALAPSVVAAAGGGDLRPGLLLGAGTVLAAAAGRVRPARRDRFAVAVAALVAAGVGVLRPVAALLHAATGLAAVEVWSLPAAALLLAAGAAAGLPAGPATAALPGGPRGWQRARLSWRELRAVPALALGAGLPLLAAVAGGRPARFGATPGALLAGWRCAAVLLLAGAVAVLAARRRQGLLSGAVGRWAAGAAVAAATLGWALTGVPVEAWSLPLAAVLVLAAMLRAPAPAGAPGAAPGPRPPARARWRAALPGAVAGLVPSLVMAPGGGALRPGLLLAAATVLAAAGWWEARGAGPVPAVLPVPSGLGAATAAAVGVFRPAVGILTAGATPALVEAWSVPAALIVLLALHGGGRRAPGPHRVPEVTAALLLACVPTLLAMAADVAVAAADPGRAAPRWDDLRGGWVLALAGLTVALAALPRARVAAPMPPRLWVALALAIGAAPLGWAAGPDHPVERWTVPLAAVLLVAGATRMAVAPALRSWPALGPGVAVLLVPTLCVAAVAGGTARVVALVLLSAGVLVAGVARRRQAPVLLGAVALAVHAGIQLGPWLAAVTSTAPRWLVLAIVGGALLGLGATYERQVRQLRGARLVLTAMR